jgi:hypothetical protein
MPTIGKKVFETPSQEKKLAKMVHLSSKLLQKTRIGELQSRLPWAKRETLFQK